MDKWILLFFIWSVFFVSRFLGYFYSEVGKVCSYFVWGVFFLFLFRRMNREIYGGFARVGFVFVRRFFVFVSFFLEFRRWLRLFNLFYR